MLSTTGAYDEALDRYHATGPEFDGYLSNHGPMVVEALARLGRPELIHPWSDRYLQRLDETPRGIDPIRPDTWRDALGSPGRAGDWTAFFLRLSEDDSWSNLLATWWPRLLPGIAAGATHGVIRTGHAVRALRSADSAPRRRELAHALAYWAARWQRIPAITTRGSFDASSAVAQVPRVADQSQGIRHRLAQLPTPPWTEVMESLAGPTSPDDVPADLERLVSAVLAHYATHAHGNPTMMVHAATAPMAVLNTLPSLRRELWRHSFDAAWAASGAVLAAYTPTHARPAPTTAGADEVLEQALRHGGEHVIKLTDTALRSYASTGSNHALSAALTAVTQDA